jgi:hypothetical protein
MLEFIHRWRIAIHTMTILVVFFALAIGIAWGYTRHWDGRILPGVFVGPVAIGGLTPDSARERLESAIRAYEANGIVLTYQSSSVRVAPVVGAAQNPDFTYTLVNWDATETITRAAALGRTGSWWQRWMTAPTMRFRGARIPIVATVPRSRCTRMAAKKIPGIRVCGTIPTTNWRIFPPFLASE